MAAKCERKGELKKEKRVIGFRRNLLISFEYGQLRQVLMKLVLRLLTEGLLVRIEPGGSVNVQEDETVVVLCHFRNQEAKFSARIVLARPISLGRQGPFTLERRPSGV